MKRKAQEMDLIQHKICISQEQLVDNTLELVVLSILLHTSLSIINVKNRLSPTYSFSITLICAYFSLLLPKLRWSGI